jgi:6-phosphogluconolactonase/glucosamine-6-phosphate isomerase/deaminase
MKEKIEILEEDNNNVSEYVLEQENTISNLEQMMNKLIEKMDIQNKQLNEQNNKLDKQSEEMTIMQCTLNKIVKKLDDRAVPPSDDELTERFVLMKKNDNTFYVIRSQERRMYKAIQEKEKLGYKKIDDLLESETIPNSMYLWNCIRDELVKERKIKCKYNEIMLSSITELELVDIIKQVFDSRKQVN